MRRLLLPAILAALLVPATARANDRVCCDQGKTVVESRDPEQMRIARVSGFCQMGPRFGFASCAQSFAEKDFGGQGKACSCR